LSSRPGPGRIRDFVLIDGEIVEDLRIVGADYPLNSRGGHILPQAEQEAMSAYASKAFAGVAREEIVVALSHHPEFFPIAAASGAQLTLASHTHGGQVSLFGRPLVKAYDYVHGPFENGGASLDVSAGAGDWCLFGSLLRGRSSSSPFGKGDSGATVEPSPGVKSRPSF
jgi:predicted MPP superfamily phosphohydrolase